MSERYDEQREESLRRYQEHLIDPGERTLAQQINIWAFTHPKKDQAWKTVAGKIYTPEYFAAQVNSTEDTSAKVVIETIVAIPGKNEAGINSYQKLIEENLASPLPEDFDFKRHQTPLWEIQKKYEGKIMDIPGVHSWGMSKIDIFQPGKPDCFIIGIANKELSANLPYMLERIPIFRIVGTPEPQNLPGFK